MSSEAEIEFPGVLEINHDLSFTAHVEEAQEEEEEGQQRVVVVVPRLR